MRQLRYLLAGVILTSLHASGQTLQIAGVYDLIGQSTLCSPDSVWVDGTFPADNRSSYSATVGGETAPVNIIVSTGGVAVQINIELPTDLAPGPSNVVILHNGTPSNVFPITIAGVCPSIAADGSAFVHNSNGQTVTNAYPAAPGETISLIMSGLGHTNPILPLGATTTSPLPDAVTPAVTVAGINATVQFAGQTAGTVSYNARVTFVVPTNAPIGADKLVVTTAGVNSNPVQLMVGTTQLPAAPQITAVVNSASFQSRPIAPGSFLTLTATGLSGQDNLSAFPATSVSGYAVQIGAWQAPISAMDLSQGLINVIVPAEAPPYGTIPVTIQGPNGPAASAISMGPAGPGIFLVPDPSNPTRTNAAALLNGTAWIIMPASQTQALGLPSCTGQSATTSCGQPAHPGDTIQLYVTGLGNTTVNGNPAASVLPTGQAAPASGSPLYETTTLPTVTVNTVAAKVLFAGVVPGFAGLYAVDFQVPANTPPGDNVPLQISIAGSPIASASIAIQ